MIAMFPHTPPPAAQLPQAPWRHMLHRGLLVLVTVSVLGCATPAIREAQDMALAGQHEAALEHLNSALKTSPEHAELRMAWFKQREATVHQLALQADTARQQGRMDEAQQVLSRLQALAPQHPRTATLQADVQRQQRLQGLLTEAEQAMARQQWSQAEWALRTVLGESPQQPQARSLLARIDTLRETQTRQQAGLGLKTAQRVVTLEFREAPLRTVFEALAKAADVNFVFDKDVRGDARVTLYLRKTTVDDALRLITSTQQLGHKLLNDNTVLVFPNTQQKARDLLDTVTRTFYLVNADPKQVQQMVRTVAKSRDIYVDERLNLLVVRDTPEVMRLVEQLVQSVDLPEPEVMLELEVMEVSSSKLDQIGLKWPELLNYGVPGSTAPITSSSDLRWYAPNPLAIANLKASSGATNLLANPKIRARNREKAKVLLGEKLPVFTTTSTANVGVSASVSYLDVGLKLEIEPQVQLDNDVTIKVALEVSSITREITGPQGSIAYQVGTRQASTSLRLRDGETQILAGLINDRDIRNSSGLPVLHQLPVAGRLFGSRNDSIERTEIVLLVTPRIVRNLVQPPVAAGLLPSGTEAQPGARPMALSAGVAGSAPGGGAGQRMARSTGADAAGRALNIGAPSNVSLSGPEQAMAGSSIQLTVRNPGSQPLDTGLLVDTVVFESMAGGGAARVAIQVPPQGEQVIMLRVKEGAPSMDSAVALEDGSALWRVRVVGKDAVAAPEAGTPDPATPGGPQSPDDDADADPGQDGAGGPGR